MAPDSPTITQIKGSTLAAVHESAAAHEQRRLGGIVDADLRRSAVEGPPSTPDAVDLERGIFRVVHIEGKPGGGAGRRREREFRVDELGLQLLLDTLPTTDCIRLPSDKLIACRGTRSPANVDSLVPMMTQDQVHIEFMRREGNALMEDMAQMRRAALESTKAALQNATDLQKILGAQQDFMQAQAERTKDFIEKLEAKASGDITERIMETLANKLSPEHVTGIMGMLRRPG